MRVSHSAKVYKHSDMSNVGDRAFSIMISFRIPRKLDSVLYVWSDSESTGEEENVIAGLTYDYYVAHVIGNGLLYYTLSCDYRDSPGDFQIMATTYVADINRDNAEYIYDRLHMQFWLPHEVEYILSHRGRHWSIYRGMERIGPILVINRRKGFY